MKSRKLFADVKVDKLTASRLTTLSKKSSVHLTFKWTPKAQVVIYQLNWRVGLTDWTDALKNVPVADNDGTETIFIGDFDQETEIEFETSMMAITKVPKAALIISQDNPKLAIKIKPAGADIFKAIEATERWPEKFKFKVYANLPA